MKFHQFIRFDFLIIIQSNQNIFDVNGNFSLPTNSEKLSRFRKKRKPRAPEKGNVLEFRKKDMNKSFRNELGDTSFTKRYFNGSQLKIKYH